jgi:hypothetical protein
MKFATSTTSSGWRSITTWSDLFKWGTRLIYSAHAEEKQAETDGEDKEDKDDKEAEGEAEEESGEAEEEEEEEEEEEPEDVSLRLPAGDSNPSLVYNRNWQISQHQQSEKTVNRMNVPNPPSISSTVAIRSKLEKDGNTRIASRNYSTWCTVLMWVDLFFLHSVSLSFLAQCQNDEIEGSW